MLLDHYLYDSAQRHPDKLALVCGERRACYAEVEQGANALAHGLRALGLQRQQRVAVYFDNSVETVQGIFATLKAAGVLAQQPATLPVNRNISLDLASLVYTSGSTGLPKGVTLTHANMVAAATSITTYLRNEPDDIILSPLPLAFDYGLYQVLMAFRVGATVVLEKQFVYPYKYIELIVKERVTGLPIVYTIS